MAVLVALVVLNVVYYHLLKAYTRKGRMLMDEVDGFRMYLGAAEQARLDMLHRPDRTPETFEKYLPYALALDVENEWAEQFADVLARADTPEASGYSPAWYAGRGTSWSDVGPSGFASSIGVSFAGAIAASSTAPGRSSGGGFSGGGGGSSGGGGGGGGGGGW